MRRAVDDDGIEYARQRRGKADCLRPRADGEGDDVRACGIVAGVAVDVVNSGPQRAGTAVRGGGYYEGIAGSRRRHRNRTARTKDGETADVVDVEAKRRVVQRRGVGMGELHVEAVAAGHDLTVGAGGASHGYCLAVMGVAGCDESCEVACRSVGVAVREVKDRDIGEGLVLGGGGRSQVFGRQRGVLHKDKGSRLPPWATLGVGVMPDGNGVAACLGIGMAGVDAIDARPKGKDRVVAPAAGTGRGESAVAPVDDGGNVDVRGVGVGVKEFG